MIDEMNDERPYMYDADHPCSIPYEIRDQHVYVPGKTRHGKTTLLHRMIMGDIENGCGVTVLDPKGDLVRSLLDYIPDWRRDDTSFIDLDTPVPLDIMGFQSGEKSSMVGELKYIIEGEDSTLITADAILEDLLYSLLAIPNTTFMDVYRFFRHEDRQKEILEALKLVDLELWNRWQNDFPKPKEWQPIATRINKFWRNLSLRTILGTPKPDLNIAHVMDNRKVLLVDLGGAGEEKAIFGSLLVAKFQQAAYRRTKIDPIKRVPHFLYVDEFEHFQTSSFDKIFSVAGGLGLRLTVGNQFIGQLKEDVRRSIFGNAGTFIVFKIGEDTNLFKNVVYPYDHNELARLSKYQAMYKIGDDAPIFKWTLPQEEKPEISNAYYIKQNTLKEYGPKPRAQSAESGQKPTMEKYGGDTPLNSSNKGDGNPNASAYKEDEIKPSGPPNVPPYRDKAKGSRKSR
jgi:hypothetical protein